MKKKKKKEANEEYFDYMKTNKDSINNIIKNTKLTNNKSVFDILQDAIYRTNKIVVHTYNFLKLYTLYLYDNKMNIPIIDKQFILTVMKVVSTRNSNKGRKPNKKSVKLINKLTKFYNEYYNKTIDENDRVNDDRLCFILAYEAIDIVKNINTNIQEHYVKHVYKLINVTFGWKNKIAEINKRKINNKEKKKQKQELYQEFYNIKHDILNVTGDDYTSHKKYHKWIENNKYNIIAAKESYQKDSVHYDVCFTPQDYIKSLIFINRELAKLGTEDNPIKLFHILPLRRKIITSYVTFDTASLISLLIEKDTNGLFRNIKIKQKELWNKFFNTNHKVFKKNGYLFNYMIKSDGVACSILFIKLDSNDEPIKKLTKFQLKEMEILKENADKQYIENQDDIKKLLNKKNNYVVIDPNLSDLAYCLDKNGTKFRYTQNQRRLETRNKKYLKITDKINKTTKINGKTVKEIESELSKHNSKTCDFNEFIDYLKIKNKINKCLFDQYQKRIYRKLKWNRFINTQKSESKMVKNFEKKFGSPKNTNVIMGDYDKGNNHMKGKEPCITKRLRRILRLSGYNVYLINEFRTSKLCSNCHCEVENFLKRKSQRPKDGNKDILIWGIVRCTNLKCKQIPVQNKKVFVGSIFNRDMNAVLNMMYIVETLIKTGKRPTKYCRDK